MNPEVRKILVAGYGQELADSILASYKEIEDNFRLGKWKPSELDGGHFVEAVRRVIEKELFGNYTPFDKKIENFTNEVLKKYELAKGDESFRLLTPRLLFSIYGIRNKRGIGHLGAINANEMDASLILAAIKWVLSELVRIKSSLSPEDTHKLIHQVVEREISPVYKVGALTRIQSQKLNKQEEVLVLLLDKDAQKETDLRVSTNFKNSISRFRADVLKPMDKKRFIVYHESVCYITDLGKIEAERAILKS